MRILLVTTWYPSVAAPGSGIFVQKDAELLAKTHEVRVVHLGSPSLIGDEDAVADREHPVPVTRIPMRTMNLHHILRAGRILSRLIADSDADVLHTQAFSTLLPLMGRRLSLPWVHTEHWSTLSNPKTLSPPLRVALPLLAQRLRRPDVVTVVCDYLADPIRTTRKRPVRVVPCIVEPPDQLRDPTRDPHRPRLVAVGGLVDRKDPLCAVEMLAHLHQQGFPAALTWVGDGQLRAVVLDRAAELGIGNSLTITGTVDESEVRRQLRAADLFVLPTLAENFCVSAAEALVEGRPVVVGANGGQRDYVTDATGRLIMNQDAEQYASAVHDLWKATSTTTAREIAGTIGDRFSAVNVLSGYESAYREATGIRR